MVYDPDPIVRREYERAEPPKGDPYARTVAGMDGLTGVRTTKPSTVTTTRAIPPSVETHVVQTYMTEDGFYGAVQMVDADGRARFVLPPKVMAALYRQRDALVRKARSDRGKDRWAEMPEDKRAASVARLRSAPRGPRKPRRTRKQTA